MKVGTTVVDPRLSTRMKKYHSLILNSPEPISPISKRTSMRREREEMKVVVKMMRGNLLSRVSMRQLVTTKSPRKPKRVMKKMVVRLGNSLATTYTYYSIIISNSTLIRQWILTQEGIKVNKEPDQLRDSLKLVILMRGLSNSGQFSKMYVSQFKFLVRFWMHTLDTFFFPPPILASFGCGEHFKGYLIGLFIDLLLFSFVPDLLCFSSLFSKLSLISSVSKWLFSLLMWKECSFSSFNWDWSYYTTFSKSNTLDFNSHSLEVEGVGSREESEQSENLLPNRMDSVSFSLSNTMLRLKLGSQYSGMNQFYWENAEVFRAGGGGG